MTTAIQNAEARLLRGKLYAVGVEVIRIRWCKGEIVAEIPPEGQKILLDRWQLGYPDIPGFFLTRHPTESVTPVDHDDDGLRPESFEVAEGWSGEHFMETFFSEKAALKWMDPDYECIDDCVRIDRRHLVRTGFHNLACRLYGEAEE